MKRIITLTIICSAALLGCGKKNEPSPAPVTETSVSSVETKTETSVLTENSVDEEYSDITVSVNITRLYDGETIDIYENFLDGKEKALIVKEYHDKGPFEFNDSFEIGETYSLSEIYKIIYDAEWMADDTAGIKIYANYIDCGQDDEKELLVSIYLLGAWHEGFCVRAILKEVDNELQVLYMNSGTDSQDAAYRISDKGYYWSSGKSGLNTISSAEGYFDANVNWHFYYGRIYYLDMDAFVRDLNNYAQNYNINIDMDKDYNSDEWRDAQVFAYFFDEDDAYNYENYKCVLYLYDSNGNLDSSIYDKDSLYYKEFEEMGIEIYSEEDIDVLLKNKREEIGLDEEIINVGY